MPFLHQPKKREPWSVKAEKATYRTGLRGAIYYPTGGYYKGEWLNGYKNGKGKQILPDGRQYEGDWVCDMENGFGVQSQYDAGEKRFRLTYIGDHLNGKMHGFGRRVYENGSIYEGEFENNKRHGFGKCWHADNSYYEGQWSKDHCHGFGMFVQANGNRFEGQWKNGEKDGWGRFYHLDSGQIQDGFWVRGICTTSFMTDISYRQCAAEPTPYPLPPVKVHPETQCVQFLNQADEKLLRHNEGCPFHKYCYLVTPSQAKIAAGAS